MKMELIELAKQARANAYTPYSGFKVGAALLSADERIFTGCNVENSSYGLTLCGERTALVKAISEGARDFVTLVVIADMETPVSPCGACRQVMSELCPPDMTVILANMAGEITETTVAELLPNASRQTEARKAKLINPD